MGLNAALNMTNSEEAVEGWLKTDLDPDMAVSILDATGKDSGHISIGDFAVETDE